MMRYVSFYGEDGKILSKYGHDTLSQKECFEHARSLARWYKQRYIVVLNYENHTVVEGYCVTQEGEQYSVPDNFERKY